MRKLTMKLAVIGLLALVANLALAESTRRSLVRAVVTGCILVLVASTVEEYSNRYSPHRDWSLGDLAANYLGVLCLGMLPLWTLRRGGLAAPADASADGAAESIHPAD